VVIKTIVNKKKLKIHQKYQVRKWISTW